MQHDCNEDERYRPLEVNMFRRQNESKHHEPQIKTIKSPKNIHRCRHNEYQWLFYNLSPNSCDFSIICDPFIGGYCKSPDYILQLFSIEKWTAQSGVFHSDKEEKENEKICRKNEAHHKEVKNNQALVINMFMQVDALDLPEDAMFSCQVTYDCRKTKTPNQDIKNETKSQTTPSTTQKVSTTTLETSSSSIPLSIIKYV